MGPNEALYARDEFKKLEPADVRKKAEDMVHRHEKQLLQLKAASGANPETFRKAAEQANALFQEKLKGFLEAHHAKDLFAEIDASVHREISRIMNDHLVSSSQ